MSTLAPATPMAGDYTVVISTFNRGRFLREAVESILNQTLVAARVVIVSDGSTDNTDEVVRSLGSAVDYVRLDNGGKARALNHVLPSISTTYCWFFDDDDFAFPTAAQALLDAAEASPQAGFSFGSWDVAHTEGPLALAPAVASNYHFGSLSLREQRWQLFRHCTVMMTGAMLRTSCVRAVGGLNERLIRGQDYDLMVRLAAQFPFAYCGKPVYRWRQHAGHRGSLKQGHRSQDRLAAWAAASEPVGDYLREQLAITDWTHGSGSSAITREAQIRRTWALAPKQSIELTVAQLRVAFEEDAERPLNGEELRLLLECCSHDFIAYRGPEKLMGLAKMPAGRAASDAVLEISRGIWWLAHGDPDRRSAFRLRLTSAMLYAASRFVRLFRGRQQ